MPHTPSPRSLRVGYRLDWCAYVELLSEQRYPMTLRDAYRVVIKIDAPFPNVERYERFRSENSEEIGRRKAEIWQEASRAKNGDALEIEALARLRLSPTDAEALHEHERRERKEEARAFQSRAHNQRETLIAACKRDPKELERIVDGYLKMLARL